MIQSPPHGSFTPAGLLLRRSLSSAAPAASAPHIHYLVPGGALTKTGWVRPRHPNILVPAKPLAVRMRNRFRSALKAANFQLYLTVPHKAWSKPWNADVREVGSGARAFEYPARYVQKTALDASRINAVDSEVIA